MRLADIAAALEAEVEGDGSLEIARPVPPDQVEAATDLALVFSAEALDRALAANATAALVPDGIVVPAARLKGLIRMKAPRAALRPLTAMFAAPPHGAAGIHDSAVVDPSARLGRDVAIGPFAVIGPGSAIGDGTRILAHATIGAGVTVGAACLIHPGARIGDGTALGDRVVVQANACLGTDGFGYSIPAVPDSKRVREEGVQPFLHQIEGIASAGVLVVEDDVEIGPGTVIDRATLGATRIGRNTKISSQVMIAHNCRIGENCLIVAQSGLAGSVTLEDRVILAGKVGIIDHITIGHDSLVGARATVMRDVPPHSAVIGYPAIPMHEFFDRLKHTHLSRLRRAAQKLADLGGRVERLEKRG